MKTYTRKNIRQITGLPDKTLRWLLGKLDIQPVGAEKTFFGSPVFLYDETALDALHAYIFRRKEQRAECAKGKRCRGGCNRYLPPGELNSQQICPHCRRQKWLLNEVTHMDPLNQDPDPEVIRDIAGIVSYIAAKARK